MSYCWTICLYIVNCVKKKHRIIFGSKIIDKHQSGSI